MSSLITATSANLLVSPLAPASPDGLVATPEAPLSSTGETTDVTAMSDAFSQLLAGLMPMQALPVGDLPMTVAAGGVTEGSAIAAVGDATTTTLPSTLLATNAAVLPNVLFNAAQATTAVASTEFLVPQTPTGMSNPQTTSFPQENAVPTEASASPTASGASLLQLDQLVAEFTQADNALPPELTEPTTAEVETTAKPDALALVEEKPVTVASLSSGQSFDSPAKDSATALASPTETKVERSDEESATLETKFDPTTTGVEAVADLTPADTSNAVDAVAAPVTTAQDIPTVKGSADRSPVGQVRHEVEVSVQQGRPQVDLRLAPEHLGNVRIHLQQVNGGNVAARIIVERPEAMAQLQTTTQELTDSLAKQGIKLERLDLVLAGQSTAPTFRLEAGQSGGSASDPNREQAGQGFQQAGGFQQSSSQQQQQAQQQAVLQQQQGQVMGGRWWNRPVAATVDGLTPATGGPGPNADAQEGSSRINLQV